MTLCLVINRESMITTILVMNNNKEVIMMNMVFLSLFGIALMIKLIGEMI